MVDLSKPRRGERKKMNIDTSMLVLPRLRPARDGDYKAYVRSHQCAIKGRAGHRCVLPIEAAHIGTAGLKLKQSDYATVPLCIKAHEFTQHQMGWPRFMNTYDFNPWHVAFWLLEKWHKQIVRNES